MIAMNIRRADGRHRLMRLFLAQFALFVSISLVAPCAYAWFWSAPSWPELKRTIRQQYPAMNHLTIAQLQELQKKPDGPRLIDVRASEEIAVSHLPGALFYSSSGQIAQAFAANKNQALVIYCSVGWRSAKIVSELQSQGFTQVSNLEGSIFEWANTGLPLYRGRDSVKVVHPFNSTWQVLLKPELRALQ